MSFEIENSLIKDRRLLRLNLEDDKKKTQDLINSEKMKCQFQSLMNGFPDSDFEILDKQLSSFLDFFANCRGKCRETDLSFIHSLCFPDIIYSLFMNDSICSNYNILEKVLQIIERLTIQKCEPKKLSFLDNIFFQKLHAIIELPDNNTEIIVPSLVIISNIIDSIPDMIQSFVNSPILDDIYQKLINHNSFLIESHTSKIIMNFFPFLIDSQKQMMIKACLLKFHECCDSENLRASTSFLRLFLQNMKSNSDIREYSVQNGICYICLELIFKMKLKSPAQEFYGDLSVQILGLISQDGTESEFQILLNTKIIKDDIEMSVFDVLFNYKYSFLENDREQRIDGDSFGYICGFLKGVILRNDPFGNNFLEEFQIAEKICTCFLFNSSDKKQYSFSVMCAFTDVSYPKICPMILSDQVLPVIFESMKSMNADFILTAIHIFSNLDRIYPNLSEILSNQDFSLIIDEILSNEQDEDIIDSVLTFQKLMHL